jgi:biotin carboxylase
MKQKILLLGGSNGQIPAIKEAEKRGLCTILCDYLPDNPGRDLVDKFYLVSTTDKKKVLQVAKENKIDYVWAYASDPAALTAAHVAREMNLFGNTPESVERLSDKSLFRRFQKLNQFNIPTYIVLKESDPLPVDEIDTILPVVVKPVDSSDTKGVSRVDRTEYLDEAYKKALKYSRSGNVIVEEFIDSSMGRLHGDAFMVDGEMKFCLLGDQFCTSEVAPLKPSCTIFPSTVCDEQIERVHSVVGGLLKKSGYKDGPVNVEIRINHKNDIYVMELGPRSGGLLTPKSILYYTGFDMLKAQIDQIMGIEPDINPSKNGCVIRFTLCSEVHGIFKDYVIPEEFKAYVSKYEIFVKRNEEVKPMNYPGSNIGVLILTFESPNAVPDKTMLFHKLNEGLSIREFSKTEKEV